MFTNKEKKICKFLAKVLVIAIFLCPISFLLNNDHLIYKVLILSYLFFVNKELTSHVVTNKEIFDGFYFYRRVTNDGSSPSKIAIWSIYMLHYTLVIICYFEWKNVS